MGKENQAFVNLLFSQKNLDADMTVGFKGNPNMGSVVLNQFSTSQAFTSAPASSSIFTIDIFLLPIAIVNGVVLALFNWLGFTPLLINSNAAITLFLITV